MTLSEIRKQILHSVSVGKLNRHQLTDSWFFALKREVAKIDYRNAKETRRAYTDSNTTKGSEKTKEERKAKDMHPIMSGFMKFAEVHLTTTVLGKIPNLCTGKELQEFLTTDEEGKVVAELCRHYFTRNGWLVDGKANLPENGTKAYDEIYQTLTEDEMKWVRSYVPYFYKLKSKEEQAKDPLPGDLKKAQLWEGGDLKSDSSGASGKHPELKASHVLSQNLLDLESKAKFDRVVEWLRFRQLEEVVVP